MNGYLWAWVGGFASAFLVSALAVLGWSLWEARPFVNQNRR